MRKELLEHSEAQASCLPFEGTDAGVNFMDASNDFNGVERAQHAVPDAPQPDSPCMIIDFAPDWSYCEVRK